MSFKINLDPPPEHPFCSNGFSLGVRLYRRPWSHLPPGPRARRPCAQGRERHDRRLCRPFCALVGAGRRSARGRRPGADTVSAAELRSARSYRRLDSDPAWAAPSSLKEKIGTWRGVNVSTRQETGIDEIIPPCSGVRGATARVLEPPTAVIAAPFPALRPADRPRVPCLARMGLGVRIRGDSG